MSQKQVYLNGQLVPAGRAAVSVSDAGFLHGASVFTTMLARNGVVFRLERHLGRLMDTVRHFGLRTDATEDSLTRTTGNLLSVNKLPDARVRITLTGGDVHGGPPTTLITADELPEYPRHWYRDGIAVIISSFRQAPDDALLGYKTGCYFARVLAMRQAAATGAAEALWFTTDHRLAEACYCNVFIVSGGKVRTPPLETPVLPGVVRQAVLELCAQLDIEVDDDSPISAEETLEADEVFLTASCSGICPVARIDARATAPAPGQVTRKIMDAYRQLLKRECPTGAKGAEK